MKSKCSGRRWRQTALEGLAGGGSTRASDSTPEEQTQGETAVAEASLGHAGSERPVENPGVTMGRWELEIEAPLILN